MCLTNTANLIDVDKLDPGQKSQLEDLKRKMKARKETLQARIDEIDEGLRKLDQKTAR